ncbi:uncharacterized protein LOC125235975 [Leguminivora glycinivorella]|uniref:uncharacterized protein LOC125235975 n=1 Tax=Leguminivora glycinivorella TaxID=1035111 RepID=UPI00200E334A|nr:uncharacterized protein LOC125235975 [Leguminivora glycinivorella]
MIWVHFVLNQELFLFYIMVNVMAYLFIILSFAMSDVIVIDPCLWYVYQLSSSFAVANGVGLFLSTLRTVNGVREYVSVLEASTGHPLLCPVNPAAEFQLLLSVELNTILRDGTMVCVDPQRSADGLWFVIWRPVDPEDLLEDVVIAALEM